MTHETIAQRIEREKLHHAEKMAELEREEVIAVNLPVAPYMIHFANKPEPWISYKAQTIAEVVDLLNAYPAPVPGYCVKDRGTSYVGPDARRYLRQGAEPSAPTWEAPELVCVSLQHYPRSHVAVHVFWWIDITRIRHQDEPGAARIQVEVEAWPWNAQPACTVHYDSQGYPNNATHALRVLDEWKRIKWSSGSVDACHWTLYQDTRQAAVDWLQKIAAGGSRS